MIYYLKGPLGKQFFKYVHFPLIFPKIDLRWQCVASLCCANTLHLCLLLMSFSFLERISASLFLRRRYETLPCPPEMTVFMQFSPPQEYASFSWGVFLRGYNSLYTLWGFLPSCYVYTPIMQNAGGGKKQTTKIVAVRRPYDLKKKSL